MLVVNEVDDGWSWVVVELVSWFCAEDSRTSEVAGMSSDSELWVMYQLGSAAVPSSVAVQGWVADVEEARVEVLVEVDVWHVMRDVSLGLSGISFL
jgi:hypothetical protein